MDLASGIRVDHSCRQHISRSLRLGWFCVRQKRCGQAGQIRVFVIRDPVAFAGGAEAGPVDPYGVEPEILRWRDLIAGLYIAPASSLEEHDRAFRCLLTFTPAAYRQLPLVLGPAP